LTESATIPVLTELWEWVNFERTRANKGYIFLHIL